RGQRSRPTGTVPPNAVDTAAGIHGAAWAESQTPPRLPVGRGFHPAPQSPSPRTRSGLTALGAPWKARPTGTLQPHPVTRWAGTLPWLLLPLFAALVPMLSGCAPSRAASSAATGATAPEVQVITVGASRAADLELPGMVVAARSATLSAPVTGQV